MYRLSTPPANNKGPVTKCHVSHNRNTGKMFIKPESTIKCHGHGFSQPRELSTVTLDLEDFKKMVSAGKGVAPWVSPIMDTATLLKVGRDLGIRAKMIPKVVDGVQYIAFADR